MKFKELNKEAKEFAIKDEIRYIVNSELFGDKLLDYIKKENVEIDLREMSDSGDYNFNNKG